ASVPQKASTTLPHRMKSRYAKANTITSATPPSNTRAARKVNSASASNRPHGVRERIETNDSTALARNARLPSPSSLSNNQCTVPGGASLPILSTVTQTPSIVADVGRICRETAWLRSMTLFSLREVATSLAHEVGRLLIE